MERCRLESPAPSSRGSLSKKPISLSLTQFHTQPNASSLSPLSPADSQRHRRLQPKQPQIEAALLLFKQSRHAIDASVARSNHRVAPPSNKERSRPLFRRRPASRRLSPPSAALRRFCRLTSSQRHQPPSAAASFPPSPWSATTSTAVRCFARRTKPCSFVLRETGRRRKLTINMPNTIPHALRT